MPTISNCLQAPTRAPAISEVRPHTEQANLRKDHSLNNKNSTEQSELCQFILDRRKDTMMTSFQQQLKVNKVLYSEEKEVKEEKDLYSQQEEEEREVGEDEDEDVNNENEDDEGSAPITSHVNASEEDFDDDADAAEEDDDKEEDEEEDEEVNSANEDDESSDLITSHVYDSEEDFDDSESDSETVIHPFWFSYEEPDHIKAIFKCYSEELQIAHPDNNDRTCQDSQFFVGSVKRTKVRNNGDFTTMDEVRVYRQSPKPPGCPLPLDRKYHLLTSWNDDGLPKSVTCLNKQMKAFWSKRALDVSYLFYLPVQSKNDEGIFIVKTEETTVCYSGGPCFRKTPCYEPYLSDFKTETYFQQHLPFNLENF